MAITFQNNYPAFNLKQVTKIRLWIKQIIQKEKKQTGDINYLFESDEAVYAFNVQFLNHSTFTDIITFDSCENTTINGDIIISIDRVKENALKLKVNFETELHRVMIHGVLHLCGYKDKTKKDKEMMRKAEDRSLKLFNESA
jgi:probable rRNA maturation factor